MTEPTREDDERLLDVLDRWSHGEMKAATAMMLLAMTRGQWAGVKQRILTESARIPCACRRKANRDGGMPRRWWATGGAHA
jgi:hypothetical protein